MNTIKRKLLPFIAVVVLLVCALTVTVNADTTSVHDGRVDLDATVTLDDGTVCNLFDSEGNALIWYNDASGVLQSIRADDSRVIYKCTYKFNVGNSTVGTKEAYEVSDMWIELDSGNISKTSIVVLNLMDDDVLTNNNVNLGKPVNCVKTIQWANKVLEYAFLRLDTLAIQQQAFAGCTKLKYVNIEDLTELRQIGGSQPFSGSTALFKGETVDLTGTKLVAIAGEGTFNGVPFVDIKFPATLTTLNKWSLQGTGLVNYVFPENVTKVLDSQFKKCGKLQTIYFNSTVVSIDGNVFLECYALKDVFFVGSLDQLNALLDNTSTTGNTPLWNIVGENRENLISYQDYLALPDKSGTHIVYDYSYCEAYNEAVHSAGECIGVSYPDGFENSGVFTIDCTECVVNTYEISSPMISSLGYSYDPSSTERTIIASGYSVDSELVDLYNASNGTELEIGIFFASAESVTENAPSNLDGLHYFSNGGKNNYSTYNFKVRFPAKTDENYSKFAKAQFVASSFIFDGESYYFYQGLDLGVGELESGFLSTTLNYILGDDVEDEGCTDDPASHTYGDFVITESGTCTTPATGKRVCTLCEFEQEFVDESVTGHNWSPWSESEFLTYSRSCMVCAEAQTKDFTNITTSVVSNATLTGNAWGGVSGVYNGDWDDSAVAPKGCDITIDFTLNVAVTIDRVYVKGHGKTPSTIHTYVLYEGESEYTLLGQGSFLTSSVNSSSDREIPYFEPSKIKKATAVRILVSNSSYGEDLLEEIALIKLPDTSADLTNETVTVTYDTDLGYFENPFDYSKYVATNGTTDSHPTPTHKNTDMEFVGWYLDAEFTTPVAANTVFTENTTLYSKWVYSSVCTSPSGEHTCNEWTVVTPATCSAKGEQQAICETCGKTVVASIEKTEHTPQTVAGVEPTCSTVGMADSVCCAVCGEHISGGELLPTNDNHESDYLTTIIHPTKYVSGKANGTCELCGAEFDEELPFTATEEDLSSVDVGIKYTGGKYTNEIFTNIAPLGRVYVTSYFSGTKGGSVIDNDFATFWNADTYVDGADYTADYVEIELPAEYDIGAIVLTVPNYYSYNLGNDCYVSYDIEYWDEEAQAWVYLGTVSDKNGISLGANAEASITLDAPITAQRLRASVSHASRYAPAVIYELEVFGKAHSFNYTIESVAKQATASISGKYNDWVNGAEAFLDGDINTYWTTDIRYGGPTWALLEFPSDTYISCVQFTVRNEESRTFKLEVYENGQWVQIGDTYTASQTVGGSIISNYNNTCTFNIDIEKNISKIKLTLLSDAAYWVSYVHEITPYTVVGTTNDAPTAECLHTDLSQKSVVAPTCTSTGYTVMTCLSCNAQIKTNATDMLTHSFGEYAIATPATETTVGTKIANCANCDATCTITYEQNYEAPVVTPYRHDAPAAWAQTFDDGNYSETYEWVIPQLQKYGYRATALLSITFANTHVSPWNERLTSGVFDIGSHSYNHGGYYSGSVSTSDLLSDVVEAQYWLRSSFIGQKMLTFAAPNGATSDAVAKYLTGMFIANRNGGQGYAFYNVISDLESGRSTWGNLNSYISKSDQTEGDYVFTNADGSVIYTVNADGTYTLNNSYANAGINYVFDKEANTFVNKGYSAGTYFYVSEDYRYDFYETGSYNLVDGKFVFVNDNSGEFKLVKATVGSYENAIDTLISKGGFTVECLHSLGSGSIYSSYNSTISKFEYLAKRGVWAPSYQDLVLYLKEAQSAKVETIERTSEALTINVTDELDNYMFDYALTVKVDIDDSWQSVTVVQNGVEIPLVSIDEYRASKNMSTVSCAIENGYLYIDVIPDGGEVVITANATLDETGDGNAQVGVDIWDILG